jgi:hypothetical protein
MKTLTCDVCKHTIEQPVINRNYFHMAHRDICEPCHDDLEYLIKPIVREKSPFNYEWYNHLVQESIEKEKKKGKF